MVRNVVQTIFIILIVSSLGGCSSGGGDAGEQDESIAWITVNTPPVNIDTGDTAHVYLSGKAFISRDWVAHQCIGLACLLSWFDNSYPGVNVTWENLTTGLSGAAKSRYGTATYWEHLWSINVPIIFGVNILRVTASDPDGNIASKEITIAGNVDLLPPTVIATSPFGGETGVSPYTSIYVTFSESVEPTTVNESNFIVRTFSGNQISGTISLSESGTYATFTSSASFAANGTYIATLTTGIADLSGKSLSEDYVWSFETGEGDTEAPMVINSFPSDGSMTALLNTTINASFSENMDHSTITTNTFIVLDATDNRVDGSVSTSSYDSIDVTTFTPDNPLEPTSLYTVTIVAAVADSAGNVLENDYTWGFTTMTPDTTPPTVTSTSPSSDETGSAIDGSLFVEFNEEMDTTTITSSTFLLEDSIGEKLIGYVYNGDTFKPAANLALSETYAATITTGATDLSGNPMVQPYSWSFTTTENGIGTWLPTSTSNSPSPRSSATAVWTGQEMIVWGGYDDSVGAYTNNGGRYNPVTDSWQTISTHNAPTPCSQVDSVWTGQEMIVWCGRLSIEGNKGGRYDPTTDTWASMSTLNAPGGRSYSTVIWTGSEMIVWGGYGAAYLNSGRRYNPITDTWQPTSQTGAPAPRMHHTAVWTGSKMLVWGGDGGPFAYIGDTGGSYDPVADTWTDVSSSGFLYNKLGHVANWTGSEMVVWQGNTNSGRYNPVANNWNKIASINALVTRDSPLSNWTGTQMLVWGGSNLNSGGSYNPATDSWNLVSFTNAPSGRSDSVSVWTGTEFIVWGGSDLSSATNTGGKYTYP